LKIYIEILEALSTWRTLIQTMKRDLYNKDGELKKGNIAKEDVDNRVSRTLAIFEDIAKIEAISEMVLTSEQSQQIKNIRLDATNGTDEHDLNKTFELTIENIKSLENVIAKQAKNELFD
jgi:DNA gyrase/topoisomerase IV subunit A